MYKVHLLPALFGDSILIEYGKESKPSYILIDGGPYFAFKQIVPALNKVAPKLKELELLVVTHIDIDHIDGVITLLNQPELPFKIKDVWFNGYTEIKSIKSDMLGALQGEYVSMLLKKNKLPHNKAFSGKAVVVNDYSKLPVKKLPGGMELTLLSPGKEGLVNLRRKWDAEIAEVESKSSIEARWKKAKGYSQVMSDLLGFDVDKLQQAIVPGDKSAANQSSIAFIGTYDGKSCLFAGDATSEYLLKAIDPLLQKTGKKKLSLDAWKLAHHGSKKSNQAALMKKIDTKIMLVSSDGSRYGHPDPECIAKLLGENKQGISFYFNYRSESNKMWDDAKLKKKYNYTTIYPADKFGISLVLKA